MNNMDALIQDKTNFKTKFKSKLTTTLFGPGPRPLLRWAALLGPLLICTSCAVSPRTSAVSPSSYAYPASASATSPSALASLTSSPLEQAAVEQLEQEVDESSSLAEEQSLIKQDAAVGTAQWGTDQEGQASLSLSYDQRHFDFWRNYFQNKGRETFNRHLENGAAVESTVRDILRREGVPEDLYYVGLIESGYNKRIKSKANAVGPWQFMRGTAQIYGLRIDQYVDERYNLYKSTQAAARYFKDLHNIFGSWELALCAYNAGEYRIIRAIRQGKSRDYRRLVEQNLIPKETVYYIPKMAAARAIARHPQDYDFAPYQFAGDFYHQVAPTSLDHNFSLAQVSAYLGVNLADLQKLNTDIRGLEVQASPRRPFNFYIPLTAKDKLPIKVATLTLKNTHPAKVRGTVGHRDIYVVRPGDNLSTIARKFKILPQQLMAVNHLRSSAIRPGQKLKLSGGDAVLAAPSGKRTAVRAAPSKTLFYTVRRKDTLSSIARKFQKRPEDLMKANNLKTATIRPYQRLKIPL